LILNWYKEFWGEEEFIKFSYFSKIIKKSIIVRLMTEKSAINKIENEIFINNEGVDGVTPQDWIAIENKIQYKISPYLGHSFGLILDQRLQRSWVQNHVKNMTVLNLFSSSGAYSMAAVLGQAAKVISVDTSKNALNRMKQNLELNKLDSDRCVFLCRDSISYIEQCRNKNIKYDLIICDSPSFMRREKGFFKIELGLEDLFKNCLQCLNPKGVIIFATHFDNFYLDEIQKIILKAQKILNILEIEINCVLPSLDYELADEKANLKSFIIKIG
jgi:23S rRNA (cytosine1962-C5)-methyltransferase